MKNSSDLIEARNFANDKSAKNMDYEGNRLLDGVGPMSIVLMTFIWWISLMLVGGVAPLVQAEGHDGLYGEDHKITICKSTASEDNPFVKINVDKSTVMVGEGGLQVSGENINNIIPPFEGFAGHNWDEVYEKYSNLKGEYIFDKKCKIDMPKEEYFTIHAHKIVCDDVEYLPQWHRGEDITDLTAESFVSDNCYCELTEGWYFEWGVDGKVQDPGGDYVGRAQGDWNTFGPTNSSGLATVKINIDDVASTSRVWVREVLKKDYLPFSDVKDNQEYIPSAEMWCHKDVVNYDNYDFILNPEAGEEYYCVAFNVYEGVEKPTVELMADPDTITQGVTSTLTWTSENADQCSSDDFVIEENATTTEGSVIVSPSHTTTYEITCEGPGGTATDTAKIVVESPYPVATVHAHKIVCTDENEMPKFGTGGPDITEYTAEEWVATYDSCDLVKDWQFQWAPQGTPNPDDPPYEPLYGEAEGSWTTFGPTDEDGKATVYLTADDIAGKSFIWVREVLKEGYIPFTYGPNNETNADSHSAEMYCHVDVLNYDNYDRVDGIAVDNTYYCVAWNMPESPDSCLMPDNLEDDGKIEFGQSYGDNERSLQEIFVDEEFDIDADNDQKNYQIWHADDKTTVKLTVEFLAAYAGNSNVFGYYINGDIGTFEPLFKNKHHSDFTDVRKASVGEHISVEVFGAGEIAFAIYTEGTGGKNVWSTENALNIDSKRHAVVYEGEDIEQYIIAFEDLEHLGDADFNDMVVKVTVDECPLIKPIIPTVTLEADPSEVYEGGTSTLTWYSENAVSCYSDDFETDDKTSGTTTVAVYEETVFKVTCESETRHKESASVIVYVEDIYKPYASISADPQIVYKGASTTLAWSSGNVDSCVGVNFDNDGKLSGTTTVYNLQKTTVFEIECQYGGEGTVSDSVTVTVKDPDDPDKPHTSISADPRTVNRGGSTKLTWSSEHVDSCVGVNFDNDGKLSGTKTITNLRTTTKFTIECEYGDGGTVSDSVTVTVRSRGGGGALVLPIAQLYIINEDIEGLTEESTVIVSWDTNLPATSQVVYGTESFSDGDIDMQSDTFGYQDKTLEMDNDQEEHYMGVMDLMPNQTYYFRPVSRAGDLLAIGAELSFTTPEGEVAAITECRYLEDYLRIDFDNNPAEVYKLQVFLNDFENIKTPINGVFDRATFDSVVRFQERYATKVLTPWGYTSGTGYVYITTKKLINEIVCQKDILLSASEAEEIRNYRIFMGVLAREGFIPPFTQEEAEMIRERYGEDVSDLIGEDNQEGEVVSQPLEEMEIGLGGVDDKESDERRRGFLASVASAVISLPAGLEGGARNFVMLVLVVLLMYLLTLFFIPSTLETSDSEGRTFFRRVTLFSSLALVALLAAFAFSVEGLIVPLSVILAVSIIVVFFQIKSRGKPINQELDLGED